MDILLDGAPDVNALSWSEHLELVRQGAQETITRHRRRREARRAIHNGGIWPTPIRPDGTRGLIRDVVAPLDDIGAAVAQGRHFLRSLESAVQTGNLVRVRELVDTADQVFAAIPALLWASREALTTAQEAATTDSQDLRHLRSMWRVIAQDQDVRTA